MARQILQRIEIDKAMQIAIAFHQLRFVDIPDIQTFNRRTQTAFPVAPQHALNLIQAT